MLSFSFTERSAPKRPDHRLDIPGRIPSPSHISQVVRAELDSDDWLPEVAKLGNKTYTQMRVIILEFLDTDILNISSADCSSFLSPLLASWDIDLSTFAEFLQDDTLSGDASAEEVEFLRKLQFKGKRPSALYYYRALQNLRDPLHFWAAQE